MGKVVLRVKIGTMPGSVCEFRSIRKPPKVGQRVKVRSQVDREMNMPWESCIVRSIEGGIYFLERW